MLVFFISPFLHSCTFSHFQLGCPSVLESRIRRSGGRVPAQNNTDWDLTMSPCLQLFAHYLYFTTSILFYSGHEPALLAMWNFLCALAA